MGKLGPHTIRSTADALEWARVAPVVKAIDDLTALRQSPRATVRIFRRYFPDQNLERGGARAVDEVLAALGDAPATHVEVYNETAQRLGQGLEQYVDFTANALRRLRERRPDLVLVAFCFSTGNPEADDWNYLRQHEFGGAKVIGLHEYWGNQGFTTWNALRYRRVHMWTEEDHPPFLITECGRDRVEGGHGGWRADGLTEDAYAAELFAYEAELLKDPYVLAATPFTGGPTPDWANFDTDPISGRMAAAAGPLPTPPPEVPVAELLGVDVSNWQKAVDWPAVAASGRSFAWIKASEDPLFVDGYFARNWAGARSAGLARGAYHFCRPSASAPAASVTLLQGQIDAVGGLQPGDMVALDVEDERVPAGQNLLQWVAEWLDLAERVFGVRPVIYSGHWYMQPHGLEDPALGGYPLWYASYQDQPPPAPTGWDRLSFWQFTAHGTVPGITGATDENRFFGTAADLRALGKPAPVGVDWEAPVFAPIYQGASAVGGMPDKTSEDEQTAQEIIALMDKLKAAHPAA